MDSVSTKTFTGGPVESTPVAAAFSEKDMLIIFNAAVSLMTGTAINGTLRLKPAVAVKWAASTLGIARSSMPKANYEVARDNPDKGLAFVEETIAAMKKEHEEALKQDIAIEEEGIRRAIKQNAES